MSDDLRWLTTVYGGHEMLSIITIGGDHLWERTTNTKAKQLYKTMVVCNFRIQAKLQG